MALDETGITHLIVDKSRIRQRLEALSQFGLNQNGGIDRSFASKADAEARNWFFNLWGGSFSQKVKIDAAANIWAGIREEKALKPIVLGSHHDAVANGGKYDGAVGVILATEVIQTIYDHHVPTRHPLKIVSFSAEEPNPFNVSTLGSRSITGVIDQSYLEPIVHSETGEKIVDAIKRLGGDVSKLEHDRLKPGSFAAFLECHIEQGRHLYDSRHSLAVVTAITGIYRDKVTIKGEANHAGTTLMKNRHDALAAAAELTVEFENLLKVLNREDTVGTIGYMKISPNSANIIPGEAELIIEIRTSDDEQLKWILRGINGRIQRIEKERGVSIDKQNLLNQKAVPMNGQVIKALEATLAQVKEPYLKLPSMAGHDSVHMVPIGRTGMIFVPSIEGRSHCPEEKTEIDDIVKAGQLMLDTILKLDKELD